MIRKFILVYFTCFVLAILPNKAFSSERNISQISILSINSAITLSTLDYLEYQFSQIPKTSVVILKLNTPGGLVTITKEIITLIGKSQRPIGVWIHPEGASASSAGALIAASAHFIFMSPGTTIGAATPVGGGEDIQNKDLKSKIMNDLISLVKSLNNLHSRPTIPFEFMISKAQSYSAEEALKEGIIDGIISGPEELMRNLSSKPIVIEGQKTRLVLSPSIPIKEYYPTIGQSILEVIAHPTTSYFLFIIGVALIYFELQAPGGFVAGGLGVILLILSAIAFHVLPLNIGALILIFAGIFSLFLETQLISYGILGIGGAAGVIMGSLFLFHTPNGFITVKYHIITSTLLGILATTGFITWYIFRDSKRPKKMSHFFSPLGKTGTVMSILSPKDYQIKVQGQIWNAESDEPLLIGDRIEVIHEDQEKLKLMIKKLSDQI